MLDALDAQAARFAPEEEQRNVYELYESAVHSLKTLIAELDYFSACHLSTAGDMGKEVAASFARWQELARESLGLVSAMRAVYNGEQITAPGVASHVVQLLDKQIAAKGPNNNGLTSREMETLVLVARGMVAKEIARSLAISEKTVRNHISNIYRKLDIYDRSQVVIYAMKKGLVDLNEV